MKLLIDIPYEAYYTFKCDLGKGNLNALAEIVAKGEPYIEPQKGDLISRQDVIDVLEEQLDYLRTLNKNENPTAEGKWYGVNWARNTIADLPYKQNERPKGEWKEHHIKGKDFFGNGFICECGRIVRQKENFCPNCGADMRGEEK